MSYEEINKEDRQKSEALEIAARGPEYAKYRELWYMADKASFCPDRPLHVDIELSDACNLRCKMCHHGTSDIAVGGSMDRALATRLIDECASIGVYSIKFNWRGEATLNGYLPEAVKYAKSKGILEVQINTNGLSPLKDIVIRCAESGIDRIIYSVDGFSKATYESIRTGGDYDRLIGNINSLLEWKKKNNSVKPFVRVQMVRTNINFGEVTEFIKYWKALVDDVRVSDVTDRGQGGSLSVADQVAVGRRRCPQPFQRLTVGRDGNVSACCVDWFQDYIVGDAKRERLIDIWKGEKISRMRSIQENCEHDKVDICRKCTVKESYIWKKN